MGTTSWYSFVNRRSVHVHVRSTISGHTSSAHRRLDTANQVSATSGHRHLRMSSIDYATHESFHPPERCWWVAHGLNLNITQFTTHIRTEHWTKYICMYVYIICLMFERKYTVDHVKYTILKIWINFSRPNIIIIFVWFTTELPDILQIKKID